MAPLIATLAAQPPSTVPSPVSIKLTSEITNKLRSCLQNGVPVKLIVKDGHFLLKLTDSNTVYPCPSVAETSRIDVYSLALLHAFQGRISTRLNVLTSSKLIKEYTRRQQHQAHAPVSQNLLFPASRAVSSSSSASPQPEDAEGAVSVPMQTNAGHSSSEGAVVDNYAAGEEPLARFLYFSALGPVSIKSLCASLKLSESAVVAYIGLHSQVYNANDTFIVDDVFSRNEQALLATYILKDKSYKEIKPWTWKYYSAGERLHIIHNIHNALTRLGFLETHPLRKKLTSKTSTEDSEETSPTKKQTLGGGILKLSSKIKRSATASPRPLTLASAHGSSLTLVSAHGSSAPPVPASLSSSITTSVTGSGSNYSPLPKRKLSESSASSSEDEKPLSKKTLRKHDDEDLRSTKRRKADIRRGRGSSSSGGSTISSANSALNNSDTYTSPSSINEELEQETPSPPLSSQQQPANNSIEIKTKNQKKLQFYTNLSLKFKQKYKEYELLYKTLQSTTMNSSQEKKKNLTKLFELHNQLSEWKRKLWDFDNESKSKLDIMTLTKHKKTVSTPSAVTPESSGHGQTRSGSGTTRRTATGQGASSTPSSTSTPSIVVTNGATGTSSFAGTPNSSIFDGQHTKSQTTPSIPTIREIKKNPRLPQKPVLFTKVLDY